MPSGVGPWAPAPAPDHAPAPGPYPPPLKLPLKPFVKPDVPSFCVLPKVHAPMPTPIINKVMPMLPSPWKPFHQTRKAGPMVWHTTTKTRAEAKPAAKLLTLGLREGKYRKPEPEEWGGMMKMSYLPGGMLLEPGLPGVGPLPEVVRGFVP